MESIIFTDDSATKILSGSHYNKLTPSQRMTLSASLSIIQNHRALLLYETVGSGKTYIAAALAAFCQNQDNTACHVVAPAHLLGQWQHVLKQFDVRASLHSYQTASLNRIPIPRNADDLWLIDEAHLLKNQSTNRYNNLRRLTARHKICLITATPSSLGWQDLFALMRLCGLPDKVTEPAWISAFAQAIMPQSRVPALQIENECIKQYSTIHYSITNAHPDYTSFLDTMARIQWNAILPNDDVIPISLLPTILIHRLLSHQNSCLITLKKLYQYYRNCRQPSGLILTRDLFRTLMGTDGNQLLLPFCYPSTTHPHVSETDSDIQQIAHHLKTCIQFLDSFNKRYDEKMNNLRKCLNQIDPEKKVIIFTQYADTALYIAENLKIDKPVGLITSAQAKLNQHNISPDLLIAMFDPGQSLPLSWTQNALPDTQILICTDAFACGHNLQKASVLIHFDLPWNPTTLHQREGRISRKGQSARHIQIMTMRTTNAPEMIARYEMNLISRLHTRKQLQECWQIPDIAQEIHEVLYVNAKGIPPVWSKHNDQWIPVIEPAFLDYSRSTIQHTTLNTEFRSTIQKHRKQLSPLWKQLKKIRFSKEITGHLKNFLTFTYQMAIFPQLQSDLPPVSKYIQSSMNDDNSQHTAETFFHTLQTLPIYSIPPASTPCVRITFCPKLSPSSPQIVHNLSTGFIQ